MIRVYADGSQSNRSELAHLNNETTFKEGEDYYFSAVFMHQALNGIPLRKVDQRS